MDDEKKGGGIPLREDPGERAAILNQFLEGIRTTLYRQTLFAEFELRQEWTWKSPHPWRTPSVFLRTSWRS